MYNKEQFEALVTELLKMRIQFTVIPCEMSGNEDIVVKASFWLDTFRDKDIIQHPFACSEEVKHEIRFVKGVEINEDDAIEFVWIFPHFEEEWLVEEN